MRTSKKLLSFFLAVVMIVTTCSVGFTAFAKEKQNIWSTQCEADNAFDSLNGLIDEFVPGLLMGIDVIGNPYFEKQAKAMGKTAADLTEEEKEQIIDKASLSEILQVLQPLLLNLLSGTSQQDFVDKYYPGNDVSKFDYLVTDNTMSYFTLVGICDTYSKDKVPSQKGQVNNPLSAEQRQQLADWYDLLMPISAKAVAGDDLIKSYAVKYYDDFSNTYQTAPLYNLENFDFEINDEDAAAIEGMYESFNAQLRANSVSAEVATIDSFGKLLFYCFGAGQEIVTASKYYKLLNDAEVKVDFVGEGDLMDEGELLPYEITEDITPANYKELILNSSLTTLGLVEEGQSIDWTVVACAMFGMEPEELTPELVGFVQSAFESMALNLYVNTVLPSHYKETLAAIAIREGKVSSVSEFNALVENVTYDGDAASISAEDLKTMALGLQRTYDSGKETTYADSFFSGKTTEYVTASLTFSLTMPEQFKGTSAAELFRLVTGYSKNNNYKYNLVDAFFPNFTSGSALVTGSGGVLIPGDDGLPQIINHNPNLSSIDEYLDAAKEFGYSWIFTNLTGIEGTKKDNASGQNFVIDVLNYVKNIPADDAAGTGKTELTDEERAIISGTADFAGDIGTAILNFKLNDTVLNIIQMELMGKTVEDIVNSLLVTRVNLVDALEDVWSRLVDSPVGTIIELVPLLVVLVDELLVPILANGEGDQWNGIVYGVLSTSLLSSISIDSGSYIGLSQLSWDLNELLPDIMHWLFDQENASGIEYYDEKDVTYTHIVDTGDESVRMVKEFRMAEVDTSDMKHYTVKDADGNQITRVDNDDDTATFSYKDVTSTSFDDIRNAYPDSVFTYSMHYEGNVPKLTGVYIADKALRGANITGLNKIFTKIVGGNETIGNGLGELVTELGTLFTAALDEFMATPELRNAEKHDNIGQLLGTGLNNIFVALPQLFDILENLAAEKYGIDENAWTYCYEGKIAPAGDYNDLRNKDLEELKSLAVSPDAEKTFGCFARIFVEQWIDAIIGLLNNVIGDGNTATEFTGNLPIISGLLQSLGGFGPESVFTDIFNSIFQLKRGDKYSFEFKPAESTGLVGLSADNAFFLITNVKTLVDVIMDLVGKFKTSDKDEEETASLNDGMALAEYYSSIKNEQLLAAPYNAPSYTNDELKDINGVITSLDEMLSSLLTDSSINGYGLDTAGNIASGFVSYLSNFMTADDATSLLGLINDYLYYLDGAGTRSADENGNMKPEEVYTNDNLTDIIVRTFALIETILEELLANFNYADKSYNLIVSAIEGVISPDAIGIRLDDYAGAQSKILKLSSWNEALEKNVKMDWNVAKGDKEAFFAGLSSALRLVTTILGVVIVDTGWYETIVAPVLEALCKENGVEVRLPDRNSRYHDDVIVCLLSSVAGLLDKLLASPVTTLMNALKGIAGILDDKSGTTIASIVSGAIAPIVNELKGAANILELESTKLGPISPTLKNTVLEFAGKLGKYAETNSNNELVNIQIRNINLCGSNLIDIVNKFIGDAFNNIFNNYDTTIVLHDIDWSVLNKAETPAHVLAYILSYAVDMVVDNENLAVILALIFKDKEISDTVNTVVGAIQNGSIDGKSIVTILNKVLKLVNSPGMFAWTFQHYLEEKIENFSYPIGITKSKADEAVTDLDAVIQNIFPVLKSFGINLGGSDISGILNSKLFTNGLLTKLAVELYGALDSNATVAQVLGIIGIPCSTAGVANILMDTSYGATYSAAAQTIGAKAKWSDLKTITNKLNDKGEVVKNDKGEIETVTTYAAINWGFTDGAANAQQGFVNALVAILRPLNNVLNVFLNSGSLGIDVETILSLASSISGKEIFVNIGSVYARGTITVSGTSLIIDIMPVDADHNPLAGGENTRVVLDANALNNLAIYGANGYNSAIIPLLEAFGCDGIVNAAQYANDVASAKDNLLLDILNPIVGGNNSLLNKIAAKPIETIATILPNVAVYIDAHGLSQLVAKLLAPVIDIVEEVSSIVDVNTIIVTLLGADEGTSLGDALASLLGLPTGILKVDLADISSINIEDVIIPLVNMLLKKTGIVLPEINWAALTQFGTETTYTSLAADVNGNALTGKKLKDVDYGKVLITVLRYVANTLITNGTTIQNLIVSKLSKDEAAAKKNATVIGIINNVFGQIKTHTADQIITAIYYFFIGDPTDTLWDYTNYKTVNSTFKMPEGITDDDVSNLIAFLDGIVEEIDLNVLLNQYLYTDKMINLIAKGVYVSLGGIKINDSLKVGDILALVGINLDTKSVAGLLADKSYGETAQFKSATETISAAANWSAVNFDSLKWGVKDQKTFLNALVAVLRPLDGLLDALLADGKLNILEGIDIPGSNDYVNAIVPLLEAFKCENIPSYETYLADKTKNKDALLLDILNPLFGFVDKVVANPINTLATTIPNIALFIANEGLIQLVMNLITPITAIINDVNPIIDVDALLKDLLKNNTKLKDLSISGLDKFLAQYIGSNNIIPLVNSLLAKTGIVIPAIDWFQLAALGTVTDGKSAVNCKGTRKVVDGDAAKVIISLLNFVIETVISNSEAIKNLIGDKYKGTLKDILDMIFNLKPEEILKLLFKFLALTDLAKGSGKQAYWTYKHYKSVNSKFTYPAGISAKDADDAIKQLDNAVGGVFALLSGLGVVKSDDLSGLVGDLLFTNEMLTKLAKALYGALDSEKISPYLTKAGIAVSTKDVAKILTDKSYGKTFSSAAKTINAAKSWDKVDKVNWGFTNGAKNAEQGFINGLVAILRPFIDVLGPFLNGSDLALGEIVYGIVCALDIHSGDKKKGETLITLSNGKLKIETQSNGVYSTALDLNLSNLKTLKELNLNGANAYESAIIPLLDVLQVDNKEIKTFKQYVKDCNKAKDNVLLDVLNPLMSFIDRVLEAPFDTITAVLPNLAYFIDNNGIAQLLDNVLSPVTNLLKDFKKDGVDVDKILKSILGKDLGKLITDLIGLKGVKLNLKLTDLKSCNIQEILVPLINKLLKKTGITLPDFKWSTIASHGQAVTSKSQAMNAEGKYTNKEIIANKGEVLVAVLRYVADTLVKNSKSLRDLLCGIDAIKKNDLISSIIKSVFNTIGASDKDDIVRAVFYLLNSRPENAFWDYTAYETGEYTFSYPDSVDTDFLVKLPPMLDGLISGLADLNKLIGGVLFKDELVSKLATGLYGAIEGVKVGDGNLANLLAQTGIDFTAANVANLLTDPAYGKSYDSAASVIKSAGSWKNVNPEALKWGVTDRDSFFHALVAVLRPIFPVLDVLLNDAYLGLFNIVRIPGSNGYTSSIVPLMEAFSMYNIKTQYQYRQDINEEYDNILLDIINPLWDKIEDILSAPLQMVASMLPNLALFIGNDGLCQIIDNLLTPVSALVDAIKPVVNLNDLLSAVLSGLKVDLGSILGKIGITNFNLDLYDLNATLKPILGGDAIIPLVNNILGLIKIGGQPLGIKLNDVDWLQLASHGETIVAASQAATYGSRVFVEGDCSETLIAVLRYLIDTVNAGDNFDMISGLIGGLLGDKLSDSIADVIDQVLGMLQGDTDEVIASLVDLLQTLS